MFNIDFSSVTNSWRFLLDGASFTLELTLVAVTGGLLLGTLIAVARLSHKWWLKTLASAYVNAIRSVPLVLLLFWVFFLMPELLRYLVGASRPITVEASVSAMVTFVVFEAAYFAEIYRSGIVSMDRGQYEAAKLLGYSKGQTFVRIILPQVVKRILPAITNEVITLVKDTSLAFSISYVEMFTIAKQIAAAKTTMVPCGAAGIFYYIFNFVVAWVMELLEKKFSYYH